MSTETPVKTSCNKRELSSPEDLFDSKKNRLSNSPDTASMESSDESQTVVLSHVTFSKEDLSFLSKELCVSFQQQMETMVTNIVTKIVPELLKGVEKSLESKISILEDENYLLRERVSKLEASQDQAEQYSRRNCHRISGFPEFQGENTDELVLNMAKAIGANVSINEIDRSHRVGKVILADPGTPDPDTPDPDIPEPRPRDVIVKFISYRSRQKFYSKRARKCGYEGKFINEDLTRKRTLRG